MDFKISREYGAVANNLGAVNSQQLVKKHCKEEHCKKRGFVHNLKCLKRTFSPGHGEISYVITEKTRVILIRGSFFAMYRKLCPPPYCLQAGTFIKESESNERCGGHWVKLKRTQFFSIPTSGTFTDHHGTSNVMRHCS